MKVLWILWRYLSVEYLRWFFMCVLGFTGLTVVVDLIEKSKKFLDNDASLSEVARYALFQFPEFLSYTLPFAALFAMLIALAGMSRRNEITAMLAGGVGRRAIVAPMALLALAASLGQFALTEYVVPETNARKRYVYDVEIRGKNYARHRDRRNRWFYVDGGFLNVGLIDQGKHVLSSVLFLKPGEAGAPPLRIEGTAAHWDAKDEVWRLVDARAATVDTTGMLALDRDEEGVLPVSIRPQDLADKVRKTEEWSAKDLRKIIRDRERLGQDVVRERVDLYSRYAMPLAGFVMALLGAPFAFREHRRGGAATGFLTGVVIAFAYFVIFAFSDALGRAGALPPGMAAWLPNMVFGGAGLYLAATLDSL